MVDAGIRRINVSLDSRDPERFRYITRHGDVSQVLGGITAATRRGARDQDQHGRAEGPQRGRDRADARLVRATRASTCR